MCCGWAAGEGSLGLSQFRGVYGADVESGGGEAFTGPGEGGPDEDGVSNPNHVGGAGFRRIDGYADPSSEVGGVDPGRIDEQGVLGNGGHSGLEVEAATDVDAVDAVPVVGDDGLDLVQGVGIASARDTDVDVLSDHEDVAAVEDPRLPNMGEWTMGLERPFDGRPFTAPGGHPGPSDDGDFVEDYGYVLDEDRVGQVRFLVEALDPTPEFTKGRVVEGVLGLGNVNVNWPAIEMGEFAASDGRAHAPSDGDMHAGDRNRTLGVRGIAGVLQRLPGWLTGSS